MQLLASAADQGWSSESVVTPAPGAASRPDRGGQIFENNNEKEHGKKKENKHAMDMICGNAWKRTKKFRLLKLARIGLGQQRVSCNRSKREAEERHT